MQTELIEALKNHPAVQQMLAEQEAERLAARAELIATLADSKTRSAAELAPIDRALAGLKTEITNAEDQLRGMKHKSDTLVIEGGRIRLHAERQQAELTQRILAGADPRIGQFMAWCWRASNLADFASHRATPAATEVMGIDYTGASVTAARRVSSLVASALEQAKVMQLQALSAAEVHRTLSAMAAEVYAAYEEVHGSRPHVLPADYTAPLI